MENKFRAGDYIKHEKFGYLEINQVYTDDNGERRADFRVRFRDGTAQNIGFLLGDLQKAERPAPSHADVPKPFPSVGDWVSHGFAEMQIDELYDCEGEQRAICKLSVWKREAKVTRYADFPVRILVKFSDNH